MLPMYSWCNFQGVKFSLLKATSQLFGLENYCFKLAFLCSAWTVFLAFFSLPCPVTNFLPWAFLFINSCHYSVCE